ncbi:hypothetical protein [Brumimicrobium aurantiacum]|uniref:Uncharacterized protein n=1 Tax=Brumimicrobium aurantiacum TaxID=1737063 RepID=A0A3E1EWD1_9FLAO|nr:hypothetical protein [Brumimicrobium aurantiacum]RFC53803.1 hypothetical protein DXU93_11795 [Brumimicrobium aurantiacum]
MRELLPLTISSSISAKPSVLLTPEFEKFTFIQPLNSDFILAQTIYSLLHKHFKIETLEAGKFKLNQVNYLLAKEHEGIVNVDNWIDCLWTSKRKFNHLLNPDKLFVMYLVNLFFPVFGETKKLLLPGKKDRFVVDAYPILTNKEGIYFKTIDLNQLGITQFEFKSLFAYLRDDLPQILDDFSVLHHDNLYKDLKYQVSLYPSIRNKYWNELKKCFEPDFKTFAFAEVENYLLKL